MKSPQQLYFLQRAYSFPGLRVQVAATVCFQDLSRFSWHRLQAIGPHVVEPKTQVAVTPRIVALSGNYYPRPPSSISIKIPDLFECLAFVMQTSKSMISKDLRKSPVHHEYSCNARRLP